MLTVHPEPFSPRVAQLEHVEGLTIARHFALALEAGVLAEADVARVAVYLDGEPLERCAETLAITPAAGSMIALVVEPLGGGGGRGKNAGQILAQIAIVAIASWVGGPVGGGLAKLGAPAIVAQIGSAIASAAVLTAGNYAISAVFAPEQQERAKANDRYALTGATNEFRPWGTMPLQLGGGWVAGDLAAKTFTQTIGDDVWIHGVLGWHYGPCALSDLRVGDTLASSLTESEARFVHHLAPGPRVWSLYPSRVVQTNHADTLEDDGAPLVRAAAADGEAWAFDFTFPEGLWYNKTENGKVLDEDVAVLIEYRAVGGGAWTPAPFPPAEDYTGADLPAGTVYFRGKTQEILFRTVELPKGALPKGQYEFRFTRDLPDDDDGQGHDTTILAAIRTIEFVPPLADTTLSVTEFAIKATALNQGTLAPVTAFVEPICPVLSGGNWNTTAATSNPAALTRWLLTGPAAAKPLTAAQADLWLRDWYDACVAHDLKAGHRVSDPISQAEAVALLERSGRAGVHWTGSQLAASPWTGKPAPRQVFTGRNLADYGFEIAYPEPVHALRVQFANLDKRGEPDERIVFADGYTRETARLYETLRIDGQIDGDRAWREGRWAMAARKLLRRVSTWSCDIEHLACGLGDWATLRHAAIAKGLGEARVRVRRWSAGLVVGLRLDTPVEMVAGETYAVDIRLPGQLIRGVPLATTPGVSREITFATPRTEALSPRKGDLLAWGIAGAVTEDVEIVGIQPGPDLTARLTALPYAATALLAAESGAIPPLLSPVSLTGRTRPPTPVLQAKQGDDTGVRVGFSMAPHRGPPVAGLRGWWRLTPPAGTETSWQELPQLAADARTLVTPPPRGRSGLASGADALTVDVMIQAVARDGQVSGALTVPGIVVGPPVTGTAVTPVKSDPIYYLHSTPTTITVDPVKVTLPSGEVIDVPTVTWSPLSSDLDYLLFYRPSTGQHEIEYAYPLPPDFEPKFMRDPTLVFLGKQKTAQAGGGYSAPDTPPAGGGGGGWSMNPVSQY